MKYAVLGAGATGSIIGATLSKSGQEVVLVDPYREHMGITRNEGLKLTVGQSTEIIRIQSQNGAFYGHNQYYAENNPKRATRYFSSYQSHMSSNSIVF